MTDTREETTSHEAVNEQPMPVESLPATPDMPHGSAVVQISLVLGENGGGDVKVEGILVGTDLFDPMNPCHRLLAIIADHLPELMDELGLVHFEPDHVDPTTGAAANDSSVADDATTAG